MNVRKLLHFLAVVEAKSFSKASTQVHLSQSALSRSLQSLEIELGVPLFDRKDGKVVPSAYSAPLVEHVQRVTGEVRSLEQAVRRVKGLEEGEIRVGFGPFVAHTALRSVLGQVVTHYPTLRVRVEIANSGLLLELLRRDRLDFVIGDVRYMSDQDEDLQVVHLSKQSMMFLAHERSPLARRRQLDLSELCETPIGTPSLPAELVPAFRSAGFKDFPSVRCDDMALLLDLAASTELVAMAPAIAIPMLPGHRGLTRLPVKVPFDLFAHPGIMSHRRQTIGPAGRMLIKLVQQRFAATT